MASRPGRPRAIRPLRDFLHTEALGGALLLLAAVAALVWVNTPWRDSYESLWSTVWSIGGGSHRLDWDLHHWVNEALMTLFFLLVGLEIKRELTTGHLADRSAAVLPALAALGGMLVPAVLFSVIADAPHRSAWGIPMATDIALAVGVVALLGRRVPPGLRVFLLALAVVDDVGAVLVIAIFYGKGTSLGWLGAACAIVACAIVLVRMRFHWLWVYGVLLLFGWYFLVKAGVHPTLMGVAFGLIAPSFPLGERRHNAEGTITVVDWLEHRLHGWVSYAIVPVFALANAGVPVGIEPIRSAVSSRLGLAVIVGLVVGKMLGITLVTFGAVRLGIGRLPAGTTTRSLVGISLVAGIGFTVSIFVSELAIESPVALGTAKLSVLIASLLAAVLGVLLLRRSGGSGAPPKL